ncbi:MAG: DUF4388 domain-containing protein [Chloroflexi bacterium]|nr:DUF4388 domain-containing protein [Chloroflexota bacterium]
MTTTTTTSSPGSAANALSGSLSSLNLPAILRFLSGLRKSGELSVSYQRWQGSVALRHGALIGASLNSESGAAAFEGMAIGLPEGKFVFREEAPPPATSDWSVDVAEVAGYLSRLEAERAQLPGQLPRLGLVPALAPSSAPTTGSETVTIDADALALLPRLSRRCTVDQLAAERGLARTIRHVARLAALGLIVLETAAPPPAPVPPPAPAPPPPARRQVGLGAVARPLVGLFVRDPEPAPAARTGAPTSSPSPRLARVGSR